jgi:hypothetical protein
MGLFSRFLNPAWREVTGLEPSRQLEVCKLISLPGFLRNAVDDGLVKPFENLCSGSSDLSLKGGGRTVVPIAAQVRERVVDEAAVALLSCSAIDDDRGGLKHLAPRELPEAIAVLVLADVNERLRRDRPTTLKEAGYSSQPDEARTQLLLTWMRILNITDATFPGVVSAAYFQQTWSMMSESLLGGALLGTSRVEPRLVINKAEEVFSSMSRQGQAGIQYLARRMSE